MVTINHTTICGDTDLEIFNCAIKSLACKPNASEKELIDHLTNFGWTGESSNPLYPIQGAGTSYSTQGLSGEITGHTTFLGGHTTYAVHNVKNKSLSWDWVDRTPGFGSLDIRSEDPSGNECANECSQPGNFAFIPLANYR